MTYEEEKSILIVDDEPNVREVLSIVLESDGFSVRTAADGETALALYRESPSDIVLQDLNMPGMDGLTLLRTLKSIDPQVTSIVMTAFSSWENALEAMRVGAYDYVKKPFENTVLKNLLNQAISLKRRFQSMSDQSSQKADIAHMFGNSAAMQHIRQTINTVARTDTLVLVRGESGVGKDVTARQIHYRSLRYEEPFVAVNCGALSETLLESELFGHVKGAFTGAVTDKPGLLESAGQGTVFLDEIGDMSLATQTKFLRVLENRTFFPVGSTKERTFDARIICATNRPLEEMITQKLFREDLFYRINIIPLDLPPLRSREDDVLLLAGFFMEKFAKSLNKPIRGADEDVLQLLKAHHWPGNIRELQNTLQRAVALCEGETLKASDLTLPQFNTSTSDTAPPSPLHTSMAPTINDNLPDNGINLDAHLEAIEISYIKKALERTNNNLTEAAKLLGMSFRSIRYKVKKLGIKE